MESAEKRNLLNSKSHITSKKEKFLYYNTLSIIVKALEGSFTFIDLRNESTVSGKIVRVDGWMNVEMEDVIFYDSRGSEHRFHQFFVCKRNIRYVHVPKEISTVDLINRQLQRMSYRPKYTKPHTFKNVRASRNQEDTVRSLYTVEAPSELEDKNLATQNNIANF